MATNRGTINRVLRACACACLVLLAGCGTLTGLPGHGGGKRFAVEQELVASATRGAIKQIDLSAIRGKKVNLYVNAIGDTGAGNLTGGRFSIASQVRGDYLQAPATTARSVFPEYTQSTSSSSTTKANATAKNDETTTKTPPTPPPKPRVPPPRCSTSRSGPSPSRKARAGWPRSA